METTHSPLPSTETDGAPRESRTVFSLLSHIKDIPSCEPDSPGEIDEDIAILRLDPHTNTSTINRTAYLRLHRSSSPSRTKIIDKLKENYEKSDAEEDFVKKAQLIEELKNKQSVNLKNTKPEVKPRRSKLSKSQIIIPSKREQQKQTNRRSLDLPKNKHKDVNSNNLQDDDDDNDEESEEEYITIVRRAESEESVARFAAELSAFTMEPKKKGFQKLFSIFSHKDKPKKQDKHKLNGESLENESNNFSRQSALRHTTGSDGRANKVNINNIQRHDDVVKVPNNYIKQDYSPIHINQYNHNNVSKLDNGYTPMDKPLYKTNDTSAYINMPGIRKYIDTSSSASTLESDRSNIYHNISSPSNYDTEVELRTSSFKPNRVSDGRRDTPPRLVDTKQDVRLVNPKALIPINSERPLPNPYQNNMNDSKQPYLEETYGTVVDRINRSSTLPNKIAGKPPRSPSVEAIKLKLPPNREIVPLSPRVKSPIPSEVSTDKIIATELLKPKISPVKGRNKEYPSSYMQDEIYYRNMNNLVRQENLMQAKPPTGSKLPVLSSIPNDEHKVGSITSRSSNESIALRPKQVPIDSNPIRITTDVQIHTPTNRTPTPSNSISSQNLSLSPSRPANLNIRPTTPSESKISISPKTTPQKEDMRKSVEAYYWKEIKKMKDQENYYLMQVQYGHMPNVGYIEEPTENGRRSRSMSPVTSRNGRRSLSLPRDVRPNHVMQETYINAIPENRAVINQQPRSMQQLQFQQQQQQMYFQRNTPERSTVDGSPRKYDGTNTIYRPIFKRGSLSTPPRQIVDDSLKRKVSFSGQQPNLSSWPTKNGFTQSPPQRRIDKVPSQGDDEVFLPNDPRNNFRHDLPIEDIYNHRSMEPLYVLRASQNSLYLHQRPENPYGQQIRRLPPQQEEALYGQPIDYVHPQLTRHGSIQINEEIYGQRPGVRPISYQSPSMRQPVIRQDPQYSQMRPNGPQTSMRREIIVNDEIYGQFGGYMQNNIYASRQSMADFNNRMRDEYYRQTPKQISISNKVCDMYGQIHDATSSSTQRSGVLMGQIQPGSPNVVVRGSYAQLPNSDGFARNGRLTASVNDMYKKVPAQALYGRLEQGQNVPNKPLPPVPQGKKGKVPVSDTESGSDASEVKKNLNNSKKKRGLFKK